MSSGNVKSSKSQLRRICNATQICRPNTEKNDVKLTKNLKKLETPGSSNYQLKKKMSNINSISNPVARKKIAKISTELTNKNPTSSKVPATLANDYRVCSDSRLSNRTLNVNSINKNSVCCSDLKINSIPVNDYKNCKAKNSSFQKIEKRITAESKTKIIPETKLQKASSKRKSIGKNENELSDLELEFHKNDTNTSKKRKLKSTTASHQNCGGKSQLVHKKLRNTDVFVSTGTLYHKSSCQDILDVEHNEVLVGGSKVENISNLHEPSSSLDNIEKSVYESASQSFVSSSREDTERTTIDNKNESSLNSVVIQPLEDMENVKNECATNSLHENTFEISNINSSMPEPLLRCNIVHNCVLEMINAASYNHNSSDDSIYSCNSKCGSNCKVCLKVTDTSPPVETLKSDKDLYGYLTELVSSETTILSKPVKEIDTSYEFHMDQSLGEKLATSTSSSLQYVDGIEKKRTHIIACHVNDETNVEGEIVPDTYAKLPNKSDAKPAVAELTDYLGKPPILHYMLLKNACPKNKIDKVDLLEEVVKTEPASLSDTKTSCTISTCVETKIENSFTHEKCPDVNLFERKENFGPGPSSNIPSFNNAFNIKEDEKKDNMPILTPEPSFCIHKTDSKRLGWKDYMGFLSEYDVLIQKGLNSELKCAKCLKPFQGTKECCFHYRDCKRKREGILLESVIYACCLCYNIFKNLSSLYYHKLECYALTILCNSDNNTDNVKPKINLSDCSVSKVKSELNQILNSLIISIKNISNNSLKTEYSTCQKNISHSVCSLMHHNEVPVAKKDNLISQDCSTNVDFASNNFKSENICFETNSNPPQTDNFASCSNEVLLIELGGETEPPSNYINTDNSVPNISLQNNFASTNAVLKNICIETNLHPPQTDNLASSTNEVLSVKQAESPSNYINADSDEPNISLQNCFANIGAISKKVSIGTNSHTPQTDNLASSTNEVLSFEQVTESPSNYINENNGVPNISLQNSNGNSNKISFMNFCSKALRRIVKIPLFPDNCKFCNYPLSLQFSDLPFYEGKLILPSDIFSFSLSCKVCKEKHALDKNKVTALYNQMKREFQLKNLQNKEAGIKKEPIE